MLRLDGRSVPDVLQAINFAHRSDRSSFWRSVILSAASLRKHFDKLQERPSAVLRQYGAQNPAEFFAVATEAYFEKGDALKRTSPDLHAELKKFFGWDPGPGKLKKRRKKKRK